LVVQEVALAAGSMWLAAGCSSRGFTMKKNGAFAVKIMEYDGG